MLRREAPPQAPPPPPAAQGAGEVKGSLLRKELPPSAKILMEVTGEGDIEELIEVPEGQEEEFLAAAEEPDPSIQWGSPQKDSAQQLVEELKEATEDVGVVDVVQAIANRTDPEPPTVLNSTDVKVTVESNAAVPAPDKESASPASSEKVQAEERVDVQTAESDRVPTSTESGALPKDSIPVSATVASSALADAFADTAEEVPSSSGNAPLAVSMKPSSLRGFGFPKATAAAGSPSQNSPVTVLPLLGMLMAVAMLASFSSAARGLMCTTSTVLRTGSAAPQKHLLKSQ